MKNIPWRNGAYARVVFSTPSAGQRAELAVLLKQRTMTDFQLENAAKLALEIVVLNPATVVTIPALSAAMQLSGTAACRLRRLMNRLYRERKLTRRYRTTRDGYVHVYSAAKSVVKA